MDPKGWTKTQLENWLNSPLTQERKDFDLKVMIPPNDEGKHDLKKDFCGFANGTGGFLFFGVKNDKTIIGIKEDKEFTTKISEIITKHIFPATIKWELYECIATNDDKQYVYVIKIFESLYWQKPHVFFEQKKGLCIPVRENGNKRNITDGAELRRIFLKIDNYYPEYNIHIFNILKELKNQVRPNFSLIESNIISGYKQFLRSSSDEQFIQMIVEIEKIEKAVAASNKNHFSAITEGNVINNDFENSKIVELVDEFISKFGNKLI